MNREAEESEARSGLTAPDNKVEPKSPKLASKKAVVKELTKRSDGTFVAAAVAPEPVPSPRTYRVNRAQVLEQKVIKLKYFIIDDFHKMNKLNYLRINIEFIFENK